MILLGLKFIIGRNKSLCLPIINFMSLELALNCELIIWNRGLSYTYAPNMHLIYNKFLSHANAKSIIMKVILKNSL